MKDFYLDLNKVDSLPKKKRDMIHNYYKDMMYSFSDGRIDMANSIMNTLLMAGYLISMREQKIDQIIS